MDKRLVGKWYKEEFGETINIFDEDPLRMKMCRGTSTSDAPLRISPTN